MKNNIGGPLTQGQLFSAIKHGDRKAFEGALSEGVDVPGVRIHGKSLLRLAGELGHRDICEHLVKLGANPDESNGFRRFSLLHNAVASGNFGFASILLQLGANPMPQASNDATPLHFAARSGQQYMADQLINAGANIDAQDKQGQTPLHYAIRKSDLSMVKYLIRKNCDVNQADKRGLTPLQLAEGHGYSEVADILLESDARRNSSETKTVGLSKVAETRSQVR